MGLRPYTIWSPPYVGYCGGIRALHVLRDELIARGCEASVHYEQVLPDSIAVYPEITPGNPLLAERIVRWKLNRADLPDDGLTFAWADEMGGHPLLTVNIIEPELFYPRTGPRDGVAFWVHKGRLDDRILPPGARPITHHWPGTRHELADYLGSLDYFISFDSFTAMNLEATLLGTPVLIHSLTGFRRDEIDAQGWLKYGVAWTPEELPQARASVGEAHGFYQSLCAEFSDRIDRFVDMTQDAWPTSG